MRARLESPRACYATPGVRIGTIRRSRMICDTANGGCSDRTIVLPHLPADPYVDGAGREAPSTGASATCPRTCPRRSSSTHPEPTPAYAVFRKPLEFRKCRPNCDHLEDFKSTALPVEASP